MSEDLKLDLTEITNLFKIEKKLEKESNKNKIPQKKRFLEDKRTQSVGITIAKLPSTKIVSEALKTMNNSILTKSQIDSLFKEFITKEELELYKSMGEEGNWDKGEKYLIEINNIPNSKIKLEIWGSILSFEELYPGVNECFQYMQKACDEIKSNENFKLVLSIILTIGNIMNGGTLKGQADGFNLDLLPKLSGTKDNKGKSILAFICKKLKEKNPNFSNIKNECPNLLKASEFSINESNKELNEIKKLLNNVEKKIKLIDKNEEFYKKSEEFLNVNNEKIKELEKLSEKNIEIYQKTIKFYGYNENDNYFKASEQFFKMLINFFDDLFNSIPKNN